MINRIKRYLYRKFFRNFVQKDINAALNSIQEIITGVENDIKLIKNRTDVAVAADICVAKDPGFLVVATRVGSKDYVEMINVEKVKTIHEWKEIIDSLKRSFEPETKIFDSPYGMDEFLRE